MFPRIAAFALLSGSALACTHPSNPVVATPDTAVPVAARAASVAGTKPAQVAEHRACAARIGSAPGQGWFPYAYGALSREMGRLRESDGRAFNVRRVLDRIADAFETLPDEDRIGTQAAAEVVRAQVSRLIEGSGNQGRHAVATRRALAETHAVLRRMAEGPCRGDAALMHRISQLGEAVDAIPDDPEQQRVPLAPVLTALQRAQAALLALSTSDERRTWAPRPTALPAATTDVIDASGLPARPSDGSPALDAALPSIAPTSPTASASPP